MSNYTTHRISTAVRRVGRKLTVSKELQDGQVHGSLPERLLLDGDAVPRGGKDVAAANGHQLAALVPASHVVQHGCVVNESIQFAGEKESEGQRGAEMGYN